jgi:RHS repeat-associated protein
MDQMAAENGVFSSGGKQTVEKEYVLDYTSPLKNVIMESVKKLEAYGTLDTRTVYGLDKVSSQITQKAPGKKPDDIAKVYYHHDRSGSVDYVTDAQTGSIRSFATYDEWGKPTKISPMAIAGESWTFTQYTTHTLDPVLNVYFAQARMYDTVERRFMAVDSWKGCIDQPATLAQYTYVLDNPLCWIDIDGKVHQNVLVTDSGGGKRTPLQAVEINNPSPATKKLIDKVKASIKVYKEDKMYTYIIDEETYYDTLNFLALYSSVVDVTDFYDAFYRKGPIFNPATDLFFLIDDSYGTYNERLTALKYFNVFGMCTKNWTNQTSMDPIRMASFADAYQVSSELIRYDKWLNSMMMIGMAETVANSAAFAQGFYDAFSTPQGEALSTVYSNGGTGNGERTPEQAGISREDATRIQNAANRTIKQYMLLVVERMEQQP